MHVLRDYSQIYSSPKFGPRPNQGWAAPGMASVHKSQLLERELYSECQRLRQDKLSSWK